MIPKPYSTQDLGNWPDACLTFASGGPTVLQKVADTIVLTGIAILYSLAVLLLRLRKS